MKQYRIVFGAFIRCTQTIPSEAENDDAARQKAIEEFKARSPELHWLDPNYDNLALALDRQYPEPRSARRRSGRL